MQISTAVGISGNLERPSKTRGLVDRLVSEIAKKSGLAQQTFDLEDLGPSFPKGKRFADLDGSARRIIEGVVAADILVVGSPTSKGSYTGLFKHFFDLLDPGCLRGKPIVLAATGGGERHSLMVEHQLRPLFAFFEAFALPTAIYVSERDFSDGVLVSEPILQRIAQAVSEADRILGARSERNSRIGLVA